MFKSREAPKETLKSLDSDEDRLPAETSKLFTDSTVRDESSIQISSQIKKELADMPKPTAVDMEVGKGSQLGQEDGIGGSPEANDFQLPEDVGEFDIDDSFIKMIESELDGGGTHLDTDIESGNFHAP